MSPSVCCLCAAFNPWLVSHPLDHLWPTASINYCFCFCQYLFPNFLYPLNCFCCFRLLARGYVIRLFLFYSAFAPSFFSYTSYVFIFTPLVQTYAFPFHFCTHDYPCPSISKGLRGLGLKRGVLSRSVSTSSLCPCSSDLFPVTPPPFPHRRHLSHGAAVYCDIPFLALRRLPLRSDDFLCAPTLFGALRRFLLIEDGWAPRRTR